MPVTFCGIDLTPPNSSFEEFSGGYWHGNRIDEWEHQGFLVPGVQHLPTPYLPKRDPPRIGVLSWPTGADRFAICHLIATGEQIEAIRDVIGSVPTAQPLVFTDTPLGTGTVTADMHAVIRPISQRGDGRELYLLTLVDERFWWWASGNGQITSVTTWDQLFVDLFALVGVTADIDTVPASYLDPNPARWMVGIQPVPMLIESAARQVGMRVVRLLDGTVHVQGYSTALAVDSARWAAISDLTMAGGRLTGSDVGIISPESVDVCFFDDTSTNVTLFSLGLSAYGGVVGVADKIARWSADPASLSAPEKAAYATQAATDYYNWNLALTDATLRSFVNVDPCGLDDVVEWVHHPSKFVTRVMRPQWSDLNIYGEAFPEVESGSGAGGALEYMDECLNGYLIRKKATLTLAGMSLSQPAYAFDTSYGIPCAPTQGASGSGSSGSGSTTPDGYTFPAQFPGVTSVCPQFGPCVTVIHTVFLTTDDYYVFVNAATEDIIIHVPEWALYQEFVIIRLDNSMHTVTVEPATGSGDTINGGASVVVTGAQWSRTFITAACNSDDGWVVSNNG